MVNRMWPLKWVGFSNNKEYKNVRNAAALYAKALNTPNSNAVAKAQKNAAAKANLNNAVNRYLKRTPGAAPPPAPARPGVFSRFRRAPAAAPAAAPAPGPNGSILGNLYNNPSSNTPKLRQVPIFQSGNKYFYKPIPNGRNYATVLRRGNTINFTAYGNGAGNLYIRNNATGRFNKQVNQATANAARKSAGLTNWLKQKKNVNGLTTANNLAKAYLNGTNVPANLRNFTGNMNKNRPQGNLANPNAARNRDAFWAAVTTEMEKRAGAKQAFLNWYMDPASGAEITNKARAYRVVMNGPNGNAKRIIIPPTWNNKRTTNRKNFWNAVEAAAAQ